MKGLVGRHFRNGRTHDLCGPGKGCKRRDAKRIQKEWWRPRVMLTLTPPTRAGWSYSAPPTHPSALPGAHTFPRSTAEYKLRLILSIEVSDPILIPDNGHHGISLKPFPYFLFSPLFFSRSYDLRPNWCPFTTNFILQDEYFKLLSTYRCNLMFYFLRFSYRFCQQKSTTSFNILFDNVFKRVKGKRKAASSRSAIEWIMRGAAEMFIVGTPIQKRVKRREEGARGWREVSSKVLTRGGGEAAAGGVATSLQPHSHLRPSRFLSHLRNRIVENFVIEVVARSDDFSREREEECGWTKLWKLPFFFLMSFSRRIVNFRSKVKDFIRKHNVEEEMIEEYKS